MNAKCKFCGNNFDKKYKTQKFCSLICANRSNLNNKNYVILPKRHTKELAELFGILLGDGSVNKYFVKVYLNRIADAEYVTFVEKLLRKLFPGALATSQDRPKRGTAEIQLSSKNVCDYLKKLGFNGKKRKIPTWIENDIKFAKATVRGLFDTEGSVGVKYFKGKGGSYIYKQLTVTNKNENILKFLEKYLTILGHTPTKNSKKNIYLSNKISIDKYLKEIGSSNPKIIKKIRG
ncbi:MAG: hypothetical protein US70_C0010G0029 [Parcubacteria group bacterium GW2011_GWD2_38_11]|nr:MAG: hypothetical protein US70_C0010G0029 [Parcubacteria group bacterium GW2011_GWD2_38_11]